MAASLTKTDNATSVGERVVQLEHKTHKLYPSRKLQANTNAGAFLNLEESSFVSPDPRTVDFCVCGRSSGRGSLTARMGPCHPDGIEPGCELDGERPRFEFQLAI